MSNVTVDSLKKIHGDAAVEKFNEIASLGGYGNVPLDYEGGLDIASVLTDDNTVVSAAKKAKIAELAGVEYQKPSERTEEAPAAPNSKKGGSK